MRIVKDKYIAAVEYFARVPASNFRNAIGDAWVSGLHDPAAPGACLFRMTGSSAYYDESMVGCLTQVRGGRAVAPTERLTMAIRGDNRIPVNHWDVALEHLPVFVEWQRRLDAELGENRNG